MRLTDATDLIETTTKQVTDLDDALSGAGWTSADPTRRKLDRIRLLLQDISDALTEDACVKCLADLNDGEGWDGYCGNCADTRDHLYS